MSTWPAAAASSDASTSFSFLTTSSAPSISFRPFCLRFFSFSLIFLLLKPTRLVEHAPALLSVLDQQRVTHFVVLPQALEHLELHLLHRLRAVQPPQLERRFQGLQLLHPEGVHSQQVVFEVYAQVHSAELLDSLALALLEQHLLLCDYFAHPWVDVVRTRRSQQRVQERLLDVHQHVRAVDALRTTSWTSASTSATSL